MSKIEKALISTHVFIPKKDIADVESLRRKLTISSVYGGVGIPIYEEKPDSIGIPLYYLYRKNGMKFGDIANEVIDARTEGSKTNWKFTSELRPNQKKVIREFENYYNSQHTGFIVEAKPGFGKTILVLKMLSVLRRTALVVVPKTDLIDQWVQRILDHTDLKRDQIGIASDGSCDDPAGKQIFIGLVHTLNLDRFGDSFKNMFGVVAYDEVDRSVPPATFAPAMSMFPTKFRIGVSATIKRTDGLHFIFESHIGQVVLKGIDEGRMKPKVIIHKFSGSSGHVPTQSDKLCRRGMLLSKLAGNLARNTIIASYMNSIYKSGRKLVVISDRTEQLSFLRDFVIKKYSIPSQEIGYYARSVTLQSGKSKTISSSVMKENAKECRILMATFGMMGLGTDIPDAAAMIYATPQSDITQSRGRIERMCEGKKEPVVVDILDTSYPDALNWGRKRLQSYVNAGLKIVEYQT
jgi:superfamily II DNA or RNA helicase